MARAAEVPSNGSAGRLRFLDGLRGWAALVVVIYHSTWELFKGYAPAVQTTKPGLLNDGKLAVYVFFVLSGLVLSYPYLSTMRHSQLTKLALRRYLRLTIPIATASLLVLVALKTGWFHHQQANAIVHSDGWLGTFYQFTPSVWGWTRFSLYDVFFHYDKATSYDIVLWTMAYELAGSFLVFAILGIAGASMPARLFTLAVAAAICRWEAPVLMGFVFGAALAELMVSPILARLPKRLGDAGGTLLLGTAFLGSMLLRSTYSPQRCSWLALLVVTGVVLSNHWRDLLETRISQWLGRISFPLYLVHILIICGPGSFLILRLAWWGWSGASLVAVVASFIVIASLAAATLFFPVEALAIRTSHAFSRVILDGQQSIVRLAKAARRRAIDAAE
jgi:peptidoglycan/LPS O-acetylase OafA/YrhL